MRIKDAFKKIYFNQTALNRKDYHKSRTLFIFEGATATGVLGLTSGAFLAGYAAYLGANDQFNGIIGAVPALAGVVQVISPMVFEKLERRKFLIAILCFFYRTLLGMMVLIPLLAPNTTVRLTMLFSTYLVAYLAASFINPAGGNWIIDLTPIQYRGKYFGLRDSYMNGFVAIVTLVMGKVLDVFRSSNSTYTGFILVFSAALVLTVANFTFLSSIKEPPVRKSNVPLDLKSILTIPLKNKDFRKVIVLFALWNIASQISLSFFAVYMVTGLKLEYTYMMVMSILSTISNVILVRYWGRLADKKSWVFTTKLSILLLAIAHSIWFFVNKDTSFILIPILHILAGAAWSGINISLFNIQFIFSPVEGRTVYLGFNAAAGGLIGFLSALAGALIVGRLEGHTLNVFGFMIGNMQTVFGISGLLLSVCAGFAHFFIKTRMDG